MKSRRMNHYFLLWNSDIQKRIFRNALDIAWNDLMLPIQIIIRGEVEQLIRGYLDRRQIIIGQKNGGFPIYQYGDNIIQYQLFLI